MLLVCLALATGHGKGQETAAEKLIEEGHWKRARFLVEERVREAPEDPLGYFLRSQIRAAFGDRSTPLPLAERAVALDGQKAKYHRQVAEVLGIMAQQSGPLQQLFLARRFRKEIETALSLDPRDVQAQRDLLEFYLLAPGIAGGDRRKAKATAERIGTIDAAEGFLAQARVAGFQKQTADAEVLLKKAAGAEPASYRAQIALAQFYLEAPQQNPDGAEAAARQALKMDPCRADAYAVLAFLYAGRSTGDELESILSDATRHVPDDLFPYYRAAERLVESRRDPDKAERYVRAYLGQEPEGNRPSTAAAQQLLNRIPAGHRLSVVGNRPRAQ